MATEIELFNKRVNEGFAIVVVTEPDWFPIPESTYDEYRLHHYNSDLRINLEASAAQRQEIPPKRRLQT